VGGTKVGVLLGTLVGDAGGAGDGGSDVGLNVAGWLQAARSPISSKTTKARMPEVSLGSGGLWYRQIG
jgi:hypothetical protein